MKTIAREWFEYGLHLLNCTFDADEAARKNLQAEWESFLVNEARHEHPKKRNVDFQRAMKLLGDERVAEAIKLWRERADAMATEQDDRKKLIDACLGQLADYAEVRPGPMRFYTSIYGTTTQGFGNRRYNRASAEQYCDKLRYHGVECEIRGDDQKPPRGMQWPECWSPFYEVWAAVESNVDVQILKRRSDVTLREWLRLCWKRGVNPRVYNPFLPHGLEEKLGIDYFGNEVRT